jgi:hypothetical protein
MRNRHRLRHGPRKARANRHAALSAREESGESDETAAKLALIIAARVASAFARTSAARLADATRRSNNGHCLVKKTAHDAAARRQLPIRRSGTLT